MNRIFTVSQINSYIKGICDHDLLLKNISIKGEVSNFRKPDEKHSLSKHYYFTLKDSQSSLSCVMFASNTQNLKFELEEGMDIEVKGSVSVYERSGYCQIIVTQIDKVGIGYLSEKLELLKKELSELGWFDEEYKKPIPKYATRIGIVTSKTGAAIEDMSKTIKSLNPYVNFYLCPANVQGELAAKSIVSAIRILDKMNLDVIIVGRGGGSIEDLWSFNERIVAEAIFKCNTPVITGIGHKKDITLSDYVSDFSEITPTAAAKKAVFSYSDFIFDMNDYSYRLQELLNNRIEKLYYDLKHSINDLNRLIANIIYKNLNDLKTLEQKLLINGPVIRLNNNKNTIELQAVKINALIKKQIDLSISDFENFDLKFYELIENRINETKLYLYNINLKLNELIKSKLDNNITLLNNISPKLSSLINNIIIDRKHTLDISNNSLIHLSPYEKLNKGYSVARNSKGKVIKSINDVENNEILHIELIDGSITLEVKNINERK